MSETTDLPIKWRLEKSLVGELQARVPDLTWYSAQDNPEGVPPYGVVQCDEERETTPGSGVFYVPTAILVSHNLDQSASAEHVLKVQAVRYALETIPRPGIDDDNGVRIFGFTVSRAVQANETQDQGTLFELNVGCGLAEKPDGVTSFTEQVES